MTFQQINTPMETGVSVAINSILNSYRYNRSNWIYVPGSDNDSYLKRREQDELLLTTNTKRFMVLLVRKGKYETDDTLDPFDIQANCFIDGDYQHTITQTNGIGSNYVEAGLTQDSYWLHYSYVVFDFTPSETKNSILVTNSDGVPTKGLFTVQILEEGTTKALNHLPFNTYIRFISIGSGINTDNFAYPVYNNGISSGFLDVIRDISTGEMRGYTSKNTPNSFLVEDDSGYPYTQMCYQNIVIPIGAIDIGSDYNPDFVIDFKPLQSGVMNDELLSLNQKCIMMSEDQIGLLKVKQNNTTVNDVQTLASRRNSEISLLPMPKNGDILIVKESGTTWSFKANNLLVVEPLCNVYIGDSDGILPVGATPLVLPQTSKSITSSRPIDDAVLNYTYNLYKLFFKHKEYCLTNVNSYGDGDILFKIKEIEIPCFTQCDISKEKSTYDIMIENWNSDTTHNIFIDLIS